MNDFDSELARRIEGLQKEGLYRHLRRVNSPQSPRIEIEGEAMLNFSSNDYLGLANEPIVREAAIHAIERFGAGSGASRLICGSLSPHHELEETIAEFKGVEAAITFSSGYAGALGTICAVVGKEDVIVVDKLVHASIVDAARLSGAKLRVFAHNDLERLEDVLKWATGKRNPKLQTPNSKEIPNPKLRNSRTKEAGKRDSQLPTPNSQLRSRGKGSRTLVVTESVFSMDGDHAPLGELVQLKEKYGAWLMVDEAHATGLYGPNRRGQAEEAGVSDQIEIQMGTLGKALGSAGGYICGSRVLVDYLVNRARSFIFSTAPVPAASAAAAAAIRFVQSPAGAERCRTLWERVAEVERSPSPRPSPPGEGGSLADLGARPRVETMNSRTENENEDEKDARREGEEASDASKRPSAIIPIRIGAEDAAVEAAVFLRKSGIFVPAIRYPTVARGKARLRVTLTASHSRHDVQKLNAALGEVKSQMSGVACSQG